MGATAGSSLDSIQTVRRDPASRARLALVAVVLGALTLAVYLVAVRTASGQRLDEALKAWWLPERRHMEGEARVLARLLAAPLLVATVAGTTLVLLRRQRIDAVWVAAALVLVGPAVAITLKHDLLPRQVLVGGTFPLSNTLPSGHGAVVAITALATVWLAPVRHRGLAVVVAASFTAGAGVVLVVAALHRPSDIAASFLLMGAWTSAVLCLGGRDGPRADAGGRAVAVVAVAAGTMLLGGGIVAAQAILRELDADTAGVKEFVGGCLLVAGTGMAVVAAVAWAIRLVAVPARRQSRRS